MKLKYKMIEENLKALLLCQYLILYYEIYGVWLASVSFSGIWWYDMYALRRCAIDDLNYKLRCLDNLFE